MRYSIAILAAVLLFFSCGTSQPTAAQDPAAELAAWRGKIDEVDKEIVALLNRRAGYVEKLAPLKQQIGMAVLDPGREDIVRANLREANQGPLTDDAVTSVYESIMAAMRDLQHQSR